MSVPLPHKLEPWRAVHLGLDYAGEAPLAEFPRLAAAVLGALGPCRYRLRFGLDDRGQAVADGQAEMTVRLTCQRCLGEVACDLDAPIALALVRAAGADALGLDQGPEVAGPLEAVPLDEGPMWPLELVEDELLLALPMVPMHPPGECPAVLSTQLGAAADDGDAEVRPNPFAVLASLKDQGPHT